MPIPSQGNCGFPSFPVVDWFCPFVDLWVLPFPLEDCSVFGNFVITLIYISNDGIMVTHTGMHLNLLISPGLVVNMRSRILFPLVGSLTTCVKLFLFTISVSFLLISFPYWGFGFAMFKPQSICGRLKSPPRMMLGRLPLLPSTMGLMDFSNSSFFSDLLFGCL